MTTKFPILPALLIPALLLGGCVAQNGTKTAASLEERYASIPGRETNASPGPQAMTESIPGLSDGAVPRRVAKSEPRGAGRRSVVLLGRPDQPTRGWIIYASAPDERRLREIEAPPSEASIRAELRQNFPATNLQVLSEPRQNRFGPYGLAVGVDRAGERCVFAWQWIEGDPSAAGAASLRARLCSSTLRLDDLAALLDGLRLGDAPSPTRQADPRPRRKPQLAASVPDRPDRPPAMAARARVEPTRASTPLPGSRIEAAVPLEPAYRAAPELELPSQAWRGPAQPIRPAEPAPARRT